MANIQFDYVVASIVNKSYIVKGTLTLRGRMEQNTPQLTVAKQLSNKAILNSLYGQKQNIFMDFIMIQRSDDYTNGTGSAGDGSPNAQLNFFKASIFQPGKYHRFTDQNGNTIIGRIVDFQYVQQADEPLIYACSLQFSEGLVP